MVVSILLGGILLTTVRMYLLWYDINYNRLQSATLLKQQLTGQTTLTTTTNTNKQEIASILTQNTSICRCCAVLFTNKRCYGSSRKVTSVVFIILLLMIIFGSYQYYGENSMVFGGRAIQLVTFVAIFCYIYFNVSVWCPNRKHLHHHKHQNNDIELKLAAPNDENGSNMDLEELSDSLHLSKTFRDDFKIRYELTGTLIIFLIATIVLLVNNMTLMNENNEKYYNVRLGSIVSTIVPMLQVFVICLDCWAPYWTMKNIERQMAKAKKLLSKGIDSAIIAKGYNIAVGLFDVLSHKNGLFCSPFVCSLVLAQKNSFLAFSKTQKSINVCLNNNYSFLECFSLFLIGNVLFFALGFVTCGLSLPLYMSDVSMD